MRDGKDACVRLVGRDGAQLAHPELRGKLVAEMESKHLSLNDVVVSILAARLRVAHAPVPRRSTASADASALRLSIPWPVFDALATEARRIKSQTRTPYTENDAIRAILSAHYGLSVPARAPRTRTRV